MADSYSVTAVLSATDKNFSSVFGSAQNAADSLAGKLKSGLGFGVLVGIGQKAFSTLTGSISGFTGELEATSAAWQTFSKNAEMNGHSAKQIAATKKELQSFAQQTIYSASDMATTYAQLDAVGIKSAESLVKGFGGIAAAAENPQQAMKTLSQQGVQMAAKPTVAWQDFKLMLEQTPAGIAAVAKEMGMTASEMVQAVQNGEVSTEAFFKAVQKVGTSDAFTELATSYKTTGQALDGLSETVTNTLMPAFEVFQKRGINAVEKVIGVVEKFDGQKIADTISGIFDAFDAGGITGAIGEVTGLLDKLPDGFKKAGAAVGALGAVSLVNTVLDSGIWKTGVSGIGVLGDAVSSLPAIVNRGITSAGAKISSFNPATAVKKGLAGVRTSFQNFGTSLDDFGGQIAASMEAISPKLSEAGLKVWGAFEGAGTKISGTATNIVNTIGFGLASITSKIGGAATAITGRVGTILKPFQTLLGGITGVLGKVGGVILGVGGQLAGGLQTMMGVALQALMPAAMIGAALAGLGLLQEKFGEQINGILTMVQEKGPQVISNFANGISSRVPELITQGAALVSNLLNTIGVLAPSMVGAGVSIIQSLVGGVAQSAPQLITSAVTAVGGFASSIISAIPSLITTGMQLLLGLAQGIAANLPRMAQGAMQAVQGFIQGFTANLPTILTTAGQIVTTLLQGITQALPSLVTGAVGIIGQLAQGFISNLPLIIQTGVQVIASLALGLIQGVGTLIAGIPALFGELVNTIMSIDWLKVGSDILNAIGDGIAGAVTGFGGKVGELLGGIGEWFNGGNKAGTDYAAGATESINASAPTIGLATQTAATSVSETSSMAFLTGGTAGGASLMEGFGLGINTNLGILTESAGAAVTGVTETLTDGTLQSDADSAGQGIVESAASGIDSGASAAESAIESTMTSALASITSASAEAESAGTELGTAVVTGLATGLEPMLETMQTTLDSVTESLNSGLSSMQTAGQQAGAQFASGIRSGLTQASAAARTAGSAISSALRSVVSPVAASGKQAGSRYAAGIKAGANQAVSAAKAGASRVVAAFRSSIGPSGSAGSQAGSRYAQGIRSQSGAARSAGVTVGNSAVSGMKSKTSSAYSAGASMGSSFASGVSSKTGSARSAGSSLADAAKSGASGHSLYSVGAQLAQGFVNGIGSKIGAAKSKAAELERVAERVIAAKAKIGSPSKVMKEIGAWFGEGFSLGIASQKHSVSVASSSITNAAINTVKKEAEIHSPSKATKKLGQQMSQGLAKGIAEKEKVAAAAAEQVRKAYEAAIEAKERYQRKFDSLKATRDSAAAKYRDKLAESKRLKKLAASSKDTAEKKALTQRSQQLAKSAEVYRKYAVKTGAELTRLYNDFHGIWNSNDFLRQTKSKIDEWGTGASGWLKKRIQILQRAFGPRIKATAQSIANSFKSALNNKAKTIRDNASSIITEAMNGMIEGAKKKKDMQKKAYDKALAAQKKYEKAAKESSKLSKKYAKEAEKASGTEKKNLLAKSDQYAKLAKRQTDVAKNFSKSADKYKKAIDKYTKLAASYTKAGNVVKTAFTDAFTNKVNAAITKTTNAINNLGEKYQQKYNAIISAQTKFRDKMRELALGDILEDEKTGKKKVVLTDYNVYQKQVEQYGKNLEKLKKIMPSGMMNEILEMDTEEGLMYTQKLLSKGTAWLKRYADRYNQFQSATTKVSTEYYKPQVNKLNKEYRAAVQKEFTGLRKDLQKIGQDVMQGMADGMRSKRKTLDNAGKSLADSLIKTLKTKLKIKSPSRVMAQIGSYTGEGFVNGVSGEVRAARDAMQSLVEVPDPQLAMARGAMAMELRDDYSYTSNNVYRFESVTTLDGREIARSTAEYTETELERLRKNSERMKGRR
jgi:tape measure domain-containing protein